MEIEMLNRKVVDVAEKYYDRVHGLLVVLDEVELKEREKDILIEIARESAERLGDVIGTSLKQQL